MKYMLLIYQGDSPTPRSPEWGRLSPEEQNAVYQAYGELNQNPNVTTGVEMEEPEMATTVRAEGGKALTTDGPFAETKEAVGGYLFLEADNLDEAVQLAARIPAAWLGGAVEVRPLVER